MRSLECDRPAHYNLVAPKDVQVEPKDMCCPVGLQEEGLKRRKKEGGCAQM